MTIKRNDPCPCGSGKKYKKCCMNEETLSIEELVADELDRTIERFFANHPPQTEAHLLKKRFAQWQEAVGEYYADQMIMALVFDEYALKNRDTVWQSYIEKQYEEHVRPSTKEALATWKTPRAVIATTVASEGYELTATDDATGETFTLLRPSDRPIAEKMRFFTVLLPSGTTEGVDISMSTLLFIPEAFNDTLDQFVDRLRSSDDVQHTFAEQFLELWKSLGEAGFYGGEWSEFEKSILEEVRLFLTERNRYNEQLMQLLEDYIVAYQPSARKSATIAAGAIRFGQENGYFEPIDMTWKELGEHFGVSPSTLHRYAKEMSTYAASL